MGSVVILAPDFSPSGHPPALRVRFFARHLADFGWKPIIVATDARYYETAIDEENDKLLPPSLTVVRTKAIPAKVTRRFRLGDLGWRSLWHNWQALKRVIREHRPDLLLLPTPPSAGLLLGRLARARFGVPYVVDLIDPIATDYYWKLPPSQRPPKWWLSSRIARFLERTALRRASHITAVDASYAGDALRRYSWLTSEDVTGIPYGGEPADFDYVRSNPRANTIFEHGGGLLHCSYVGVVGPYMMPVIRALLAALRLGLGREPELFGRVRLHFVGTNYGPNAQPKVLPLASEAGVANNVTEHPARVPYLDAIQLLLASDVLVVLGSEEAHYTASKLFPYLLANRPLLAVFHQQSSVVRILREMGAEPAITFSSAADLSKQSEEIYLRWRQMLLEPNGVTIEARIHAFAPYTTRSMAAKLAAVFDNATGASKAAVASAPAGSSA